jgi:T-complex protein 1 subunit beta
MAEVVNSEADVLKGESARMSSFVGAIAIADLVKTTLGPKGACNTYEAAYAFTLPHCMTM